MNHISVKISVILCLIVTTLVIAFLLSNRPLKASGTFTAIDKTGAPIVLEWYKCGSILSPDFANFMKKIWPIARGAYVPVEMAFLKKHPEVVGTEAYFKPFEPLFKDGIEHVDWALAETKMEEILKGHFVFDPTKFSKEMLEMFAKDGSYFVLAKDASTGAPLGFITFLMRASYAPGDIKVMTFAVDTAHHNRGLGKVMMSSIFRIDRSIKRIFLSTRVTNDAALKAYQAWGFAQEINPTLDHAFNMAHWSFFEYKPECTDTLQKTAQTLKTT